MPRPGHLDTDRGETLGNFKHLKLPLATSLLSCRLVTLGTLLSFGTWSGLPQAVFNQSQQGQVIAISVTHAQHRPGVDQITEPHHHTPELHGPKPFRKECRDQTPPFRFTVRGQTVHLARLGARLAVYSWIVEAGVEVVLKFFSVSPFSAASIFSIERGASRTSSRNSVQSSIR